MNKLIKVSNNHYIVVDDSKLKEGDWKYHHALGIRKALVDGNYTNNFKITHSTQPLEEVVWWERETRKSKLGFDKIKELSLPEVEEVIYGYSVEKINPCIGIDFRVEWNNGFKAHQELVKDKLFTLDDIRKSMNYGMYYMEYHTEIAHEQFIKSLLPPTEWNIEFVDDKIKLV